MSDFPGGATTGGGPSLSILYKPVYTAAYISDENYLIGETPALKWSITRTDGVNVDNPSAATVVVRDLLGNILTTLTPDQEGETPSATLVLSKEYWFDPAIFAVQTVQYVQTLLTVVIGSQTIELLEWIRINPTYSQ